MSLSGCVVGRSRRFCMELGAIGSDHGGGLPPLPSGSGERWRRVRPPPLSFFCGRRGSGSIPRPSMGQLARGGPTAQVARRSHHPDGVRLLLGELPRMPSPGSSSTPKLDLLAAAAASQTPQPTQLIESLQRTTPLAASRRTLLPQNVSPSQPVQAAAASQLLQLNLISGPLQDLLNEDSVTRGALVRVGPRWAVCTPDGAAGSQSRHVPPPPPTLPLQGPRKHGAPPLQPHILRVGLSERLVGRPWRRLWRRLWRLPLSLDQACGQPLDDLGLSAHAACFRIATG